MSVYFPFGNFALHLGHLQIRFPKILTPIYAIEQTMNISECLVAIPIINPIKDILPMKDKKAITFTRDLKLI